MKVHAVRSSSVNLTPTVELNALAMKRREKAVYTFDPPPVPISSSSIHNHPGKGVPPGPGGYPVPPGAQYGGGPQFAYRGMNGGPGNNRAAPSMKMFPGAGQAGGVGGGMGRGRQMFGMGRMMRGMMMGGVGGVAPTEQVQVTLEVGGRQFIGYGFTAQAARHNAASKALEVLRKLPENDAGGGGGGGGSSSSGGGELASGSEVGGGGEGGKTESKSPVSMIHEIALKRSLQVSFSVKNETGPSHMKVFYTVCTVGEICVEGEGNSKKASKKHAAEKMYQELLKLPPLNVPPQGQQNGKDKDKGASPGGGGTTATGNNRQKKKSPETVKKKPKQQIIKPEAEPAEELNPISRLMQIQQAKKGKEPVYLLVDERGTARRREFEMSVEVDGVTEKGTGPNKKVAKRIAAESE